MSDPDSGAPGGLRPEEVEALLSLTRAVSSGASDPASIPPETLRLLQKAMRQRRGSVDNVAETLMATLAASGEDREGIAK